MNRSSSVAVGVDDGDRMLGAGPVDPRRRSPSRVPTLVPMALGAGRSWSCAPLLLPQQVGTPTVRDTTAGRSLIGALVARSPVASRRVLGRWASRNSCRTSTGLADVAMTQREPGMHRRPVVTDTHHRARSHRRQTDLRAVSGRCGATGTGRRSTWIVATDPHFCFLDRSDDSTRRGEN